MKTLLLFIFSCTAIFAELPKVIIFDYGGVVGTVDRQPILEFISKSLGKKTHKVKKEFYGEKLYVSFNQPKSFWEKYANHPLPDSWFEELEQHKKKIVKETPEMRKLLEKIKEQGIQLVLLSNTSPYRARFIESMGGYDLFDPILLSCYLGAKKPEFKVYHRLLKSLSWDAKDCVFIDDKIANVKASVQFGIDGIHFQSIEQLKAELQKRNIDL